MEGLNNYPGLKEALQVCVINDDFVASAVTNRWSTLAADSGSAVTQDADDPNGVVNIVTGGADNDEAYMFSPAVGVLASGKPHAAVCRLQFTEANTDDANVMFGLCSGVGGANSILDNGAGPLASYTGACWFKVDGGTRWNFEGSVSGTQQTKEINATAGGSSFQTLGIEIIPISSTQFYAIPWIDTAGGNNFVQPYEYSSVGVNPRVPQVKYLHTWSSGAAMMLFVGAKAGGANVETVKVDLIQLMKKR